MHACTGQSKVSVQGSRDFRTSDCAESGKTDAVITEPFGAIFDGLCRLTKYNAEL